MQTLITFGFFVLLSQTIAASEPSRRATGAPDLTDELNVGEEAFDLMAVDASSFDLAGGAFSPPNLNDPFQPVNRAVFKANGVLDKYFIAPTARGYGKIAPKPIKKTLRRVFSNLAAPGRLVNHLLQGDLVDAGATTGRFLLNSTIGVAGVFDVASRLGAEKRDTNFDETLSRYGAAPGPYVVLPLVGPSSARGVVGFVGDIVLDPLNQVLPTGTNMALGGGEALSIREEFDDQLRVLQEMPGDFYETSRSIYSQRVMRPAD